MRRSKAIMAVLTGVLILVGSMPAVAATAYWQDWNVQAQVEAVQTNSGRDKWVRDNTSKAPFSVTYSDLGGGNGALRIGSLGQPTGVTEESRLMYRPTDFTGVFITNTQWCKARVILAGIPAGEEVDIELRTRVFRTGASDGRRLESHWRLGNGAHTLTMFIGDTTFYHNDFTNPPQDFVLAEEQVARFFLYFNIGTISGLDTPEGLAANFSTLGAGITCDVDYIGLTDDVNYPGGAPGVGAAITVENGLGVSYNMEGFPVTLIAPPCGSADLGYVWFKDGKQLADQPYPWFDRRDTWGFPLPKPDMTWTRFGAQTGMVDFAAISAADEGTYYCVYHNGTGFVKTPDFELTLMDDPGEGGEITIEPIGSPWPLVGVPLRMTAPAGGTDYLWFLDGELLVDTANLTGTDTNVLHFAELSLDDAGVYTCVYDDGTGGKAVVEATYVLEVIPLDAVPVAGIAGLAAAVAALGMLAARKLRRH